jgi:hypothetical protein
MPNWCDCEIEIKGPRDKIHHLWEQMHELHPTEGEIALLTALVPMPPNRNTVEEAVEVWGTKREIGENDLTYTEDEEKKLAIIKGHFESAWTPPLKALQTFCSQDENDDIFIFLEYDEHGVRMCGWWDSDGNEDHWDMNRIAKLTVIEYRTGMHPITRERLMGTIDGYIEEFVENIKSGKEEQ